MRRKVLIEGISLLLVSLVSLTEGLHLISTRSPQKVHDVLGPGFYILLLSIALMITGIVHLVNYRKDLSTEKVTVNRQMRMRIVSMMGVLAIYIFLINIIGYLLASLVFFLLVFKVVGIKSWRTNFFLTLFLTAGYYIVFVQLCNIIFPKGIIFGQP